MTGPARLDVDGLHDHANNHAITTLAAPRSPVFVEHFCGGVMCHLLLRLSRLNRRGVLRSPAEFEVMC